MRFIATCSILLLLVQTNATRGEDAPANRPAVAQRTYSSPAGAAEATRGNYGGSYGPVKASSATPAVDKLDHLLKAVEHLEAAGMAEQSEQLRKQYEEVKQGQDEALLQQRLTNLERLQAEVDDLKCKTGRKGQILVHVQAVEFSIDQLRDSEATAKPTSGGSSSALVGSILRSNGGAPPAANAVKDLFPINSGVYTNWRI